MGLDEDEADDGRVRRAEHAQHAEGEAPLLDAAGAAALSAAAGG